MEFKLNLFISIFIFILFYFILQDELEKLNKASDDINSLELELDVSGGRGGEGGELERDGKEGWEGGMGRKEGGMEGWREGQTDGRMTYNKIAVSKCKPVIRLATWPSLGGIFIGCEFECKGICEMGYWWSFSVPFHESHYTPAAPKVE